LITLAGSPSPPSRQGKAPCHAGGYEVAREKVRQSQEASDRRDSASRYRVTIGPHPLRGVRRRRQQAGENQGRLRLPK